MNPIRYTRFLALAAIALLATTAPSLAQGDDDQADATHMHGEAAGHSHERAEGHGGAVTMTQAFHFETVFLPDQVRVYAYDAHQEPVDLRNTGVAGSVTLQLRGGSDPAPQAPLHLVIPEGSDDDDDDDHGGMMAMHDDDDDDHGGMMAMHDMHDDHGHEGTKAMHHVHGDDQAYLAAALDLSGVAPGQARARIALTGLPSKAEPAATYLQKVAVIAAADDDDHDDDDVHAQGDPH